MTRLRVARPTDRLEAVVAFYCDGLGLPRLGGFQDHDGYDGVFVGLPGWEAHLEFTHYRAGSPCPAPSRDNLLVLYVDCREELDRWTARMAARGHAPVEPENPYWNGRAVTFEDPDGWRVAISLRPGT